MTRLLQIVIRPVAFVVVGLIAMQPGVPSLLCAAPAAPCPMAITDVGPSCGGLMQSVAGGLQSAKVHAVPRSIAAAALPATRKMLALVVSAASAETLPASPSARLVCAPTRARVESPPIYLRNRVFRI